jgi:hypothetical protein
MFVIVDLQRVLCTQYVGVFMLNLCIKFHLCILIVSLAIAKELRAIAALHVANILLFYRVSIKSFPDYKHFLQENYQSYKKEHMLKCTNVL